MARKRYQDEEEKSERWLVSYADFITLLFAFFVVMYALSSVNEGKYRVLSESLLSAFGRAETVRVAGRPATPATDPGQAAASARPAAVRLVREAESLASIARDIQKVLAPFMEQGKVRVTQSPRGVTVEINASVLFASGDARLSPASIQALKAVAEVLKFDHHDIQVEGHTDSVPINNRTFPSNWELSAVRAGSVVRLFIDAGVAAPRLAAIGYGSTRPVESNKTEEGRQRNRRVEVLILSRQNEAPHEMRIEGKR